VAAEGPGLPPPGAVHAGSEAREPDLLADFDYELPRERIAQHPAEERDAACLYVLDRSGAAHHGRVRDLPEWLRAGDLLVVNETRVLPARLRGRKASGGAAEALLLAEPEPGSSRHRALLRTRGRLRAGLRVRFGAGDAALEATVAEVRDDGEVDLEFPAGSSPLALGEAPLPPYIRRDRPQRDDLERYQTVFARVPGSVAAPTAGLHLTPALLDALQARGVERSELVLHVGPGTFRPLKPADLRAGVLHGEAFELPPACAEAVARTRRRGGRVVAVGTTTARVLEARASDDGSVRPGRGETNLFLRPGSRFRAVDALLTNFHLPRSSLLLLLAGFAGRERVLAAYVDAVARGYRFYSYGDAMLVV
jgi:S-adenosylmethionine:tRNA ribosyltransferase-isomerase